VIVINRLDERGCINYSSPSCNIPLHGVTLVEFEFNDRNNYLVLPSVKRAKLPAIGSGGSERYNYSPVGYDVFSDSLVSSIFRV
jgi:hypothetical protein